jgi:short-subunit dehydrogenase
MGMQVTKMTNKRALITGASAGLGKEFARQLAATGKNLILVARRREPMEKLAAELRDAHGIEIEILTADMSDAAAPATSGRRSKKVSRLTTSSTTPALRVPTLSRFATGKDRTRTCDS